MKKTLLKVHTYTVYRVFTGLRYLSLYTCNAYLKSDHEITSVDANLYERVVYKIIQENKKFQMI